MNCSCSLALTSGAHFSITRRFGSPVSDVRSMRHSLSYSNGCMGGCWTRKLKRRSGGGEYQGFPWRNWIFFITRGDLPVGCRLKCFVSADGMALKRPRYDNLTRKERRNTRHTVRSPYQITSCTQNGENWCSFHFLAFLPGIFFLPLVPVTGVFLIKPVPEMSVLAEGQDFHLVLSSFSSNLEIRCHDPLMKRKKPFSCHVKESNQVTIWPSHKYLTSHCTIVSLSHPKMWVASWTKSVWLILYHPQET